MSDDAPRHDTAALFERTAVHDAPPDEPLRASEAVRIGETLKLIPVDVDTVLDVGCGPGKLLARIDRPHVFGTDLGRVGLRHAPKPVVRSSILGLPFADDSVDLVLCAEVLEHLPPADVRRACAELYRVARRHVLVTVPNREQLLEASHACPACEHVFHLHGHQQSLDADRLRGCFPTEAPALVRYAWKVRPYSPPLLRLRTRGLGLWKFSPHTFCPRCGHAEFENHEARPLYKVFGALNHLRHPTRSQDNWLLLRIDKPRGEDAP